VAEPRPEPGTLDCSVAMLTANLLTLIASGPAVLGLGLLYSLRWGAPSLAYGVYGLLDPVMLVCAVLPGIVAHELIHAAAWAWATGGGLSSIELGVRWRSLAPYAHPREPVPARAYRFGASMPLVVLGLGPALAAIATGAPRLMAWGLFFTFTAGGDILVLWLIRRVPANRMVTDHPTRVGCLIRGQAPLVTTAAGT
jgi:putative zincin peptidase